MDQYEQVEQKFGFVLPEAYRSMSEARWFDGESDSYFWLYDAEWRSSAQILDHAPAEYHKPGFVPFARTGGGDSWCWWPSAHPEIVVFCPHDDQNGKYYSPSFLGFIYRSLLDFSLDYYGIIDPQEDPKEAIELLRASVIRLSGYFPDEWRETLEALTSASLVRRTPSDEDSRLGLLTEEQYQAIVRRDLAFPLLDQEFQWMYP